MMEQKQYELAAQVLREVQKVILGKREIVEKVLMAVLAQGHVLLDDVPGVGKTTLAMAFARALGLETRRVQFTPDTMPSDILGFSVYDKQAGAFSYQPGAVMTNLLLADEINRTSTKTQAALLEAMEERRVTVDGKTHPLPQPFLCAGDAESRRLGRNAAPAPGAARPLPAVPEHGLPRPGKSGGADEGAPPRRPACAGAPRDGCRRARRPDGCRRHDVRGGPGL